MSFLKKSSQKSQKIEKQRKSKNKINIVFYYKIEYKCPVKNSITMSTLDRQLHCDEFYCGVCKQIYPSHLGIPSYGRLDCPWCHDCMKHGKSCRICANVHAWPNTSMAVKRVCKVKLECIEAALGESVSYDQFITVYENTTKWLEPYKKKSVGARLNKVANEADAIVEDAENAIVDVTKRIEMYHTFAAERSLSANIKPPALDMDAPELDCFHKGLNAPLADT